MLKVGFIGWRGMVGSVLMQRMQQENDFSKILPIFFSTSEVGNICNINNSKLLDAYNTDALMELDCIVTTQGSEYTNQILPVLRGRGYTGYWIDASSALRMQDDTIIALDPVNYDQILLGLKSGIKNYAGGNCSITLSLLGLSGLFKENLIESMSMMTYQSASGAGSQNIRELLNQMMYISDKNSNLINDTNTPILELIKQVNHTISHTDFPQKEFGAPLAGSIIPCIDSDLNNGMSKEECKGGVEANKILGLAPQTVKIDGLCIRVGAIQSHCAAITLKLNKNLSILDIEEKIKNSHKWVNYVPNNKIDSLKSLTPAAVCGSLKIAVGRLRKSSIAENTYTVLTVGDQLLWGAAEPIRRMLNIVVSYLK